MPPRMVVFVRTDGPATSEVLRDVRSVQVGGHSTPGPIYSNEIGLLIDRAFGQWELPILLGAPHGMSTFPFKRVWLGKRSPTMAEKADAAYDLEVVVSNPLDGLGQIVAFLTEKQAGGKPSAGWVAAKGREKTLEKVAESSPVDVQVKEKTGRKGRARTKRSAKGAPTGQKKATSGAKLAPQDARVAVKQLLQAGTVDFRAVVSHEVPPRDVRSIASKIAKEKPEMASYISTFLDTYRVWGEKAREHVASGGKPAHWSWGA